MPTREQRLVNRIARFLAAKDNYAWQLHPTGRQAAKQERYTRSAETIVRMTIEAVETIR